MKFYCSYCLISHLSWFHNVWNGKINVAYINNFLKETNDLTQLKETNSPNTVIKNKTLIVKMSKKYLRCSTV